MVRLAGTLLTCNERPRRTESVPDTLSDVCIHEPEPLPFDFLKLAPVRCPLNPPRQFQAIYLNGQLLFGKTLRRKDAYP